MNDAVAKARGNLILMLNNDTEAIHANWMDEMVGYAERPEIGAVGAKLLYFNNTIQHAGVVVGVNQAASHPFVGEHKDHSGYFWRLATVNNYSAVTGACMMCRKEAFNRVGGFDERFEVEYNDVDFCLRLLEAGCRNVYLPYVQLYHHESLSRGSPLVSIKKREKHIEEGKLFLELWIKYCEHDPHYNIHLSKDPYFLYTVGG